MSPDFEKVQNAQSNVRLLDKIIFIASHMKNVLVKRIFEEFRICSEGQNDRNGQNTTMVVVNAENGTSSVVSH